MYVEDYRADFYDLIKGKHVLLFVNFDVDALCTCKIFQSLFSAECTLYTLVPVQSVQELISAYEKYSEEAKFVLLVNCGGPVDIVDLLQPEADVIFFIIDSHKPANVCNIFSRTQIRLIDKPESNDKTPNFEDIFLDTETEDESDNEEISEEALLKRRERKNWEVRRNKIMFEYTLFSFYGRASSLESFDLVWKLGKDSLESLWWAIVGLTSQLVLGLIVEEKYTSELDVLQLHLSRLLSGVDQLSSSSSDLFKISAQKDLKLALYRHWSVYTSMRHSLCSALKLKLWSIRGETRLNQFLADIGLPLRESSQLFSAMEGTYRKELFSMIQSSASKYDMEDIMYHSFTLVLAFRNNYQASDYVYGILALLGDELDGKPHGERFFNALNSLSKNKTSLLDDGIVKCKQILISIVRLVQNLLDMKQVISAGPFLLFVLNEGMVDHKLYSCPSSLALLARYILHAYSSKAKDKRLKSLPLIASAPVSEEECIILGIPPCTQVIPKNFFGKAFEQAVDKIQVTPTSTYFEASAVTLSFKNRPKFLDALITILS